MGENFKRRASMVAGGHKTDVLSTLTYSSVLSHYSDQVAFAIVALNDIKVLGCDIQNAYLAAPPCEKVCSRVGAELGSEKGKIMLTVILLYGLKFYGATFRALLAETLNFIGYRP